MVCMIEEIKLNGTVIGTIINDTYVTHRRSSGIGHHFNIEHQGYAITDEKLQEIKKKGAKKVCVTEHLSNGKTKIWECPIERYLQKPRFSQGGFEPQRCVPLKEMDEIIEGGKKNMAEQKKITESDWLDAEVKLMEQQPQGGQTYEKLPSPKFVERKIETLFIDASKQFERWTDNRDGKEKTKAIIPCVHNGIKCNFWLNLKNPFYKDVIHACAAAEDKSKVKVQLVQTGTKESTRYASVQE